MSASVSAILVGYGGEAEELGETIDSLKGQTQPPSQIICVDQSVDGRFERFLAAAEPDVEVLRQVQNIGYPSACNLAARLARGEHLLFINPDARAGGDCLEVLAEVLDRRPEAAIAGAQILLPDGRVNAGDNSLHLSGLAWAGRYGLPPEDGPERPAAVVSGATLMVRRSVFEAIGGYTEGFFMYHDDVELAWRCRLAGHEVLFCPRADVVHDYEYSKGGYKWRYLERNRWWCLLTLFEGRTLAALLPLLVAVEATVWLRAHAEGWLEDKRAAWALLWRDRRSLIAHRREIQATRVVGDDVIVERMRAVVDSPFLRSPLTRAATPGLRAYRQLVLRLTGATSRRRVRRFDRA